ncbi:hypothetical protein CHS0354_022934 [Potamilus streckersoni]|uniref:Uncharacterized protein n=1 Tax=Potamilus streckersoni TaxID=2493646 RepID=A0AAE0VPT9_9BIVA|nr:hypothetical protein CHS0354_022934 [Potamilus streckersoni]
MHVSREVLMHTSLLQGVSANSWLTPPVLATKTTPTVSYATNPGCSLGVNSRMRAKCASGIMGRRHFEVDKQDIGKNEYIRGIQIKSCTSTRTSTQTGSKSSDSQTITQGIQFKSCISSRTNTPTLSKSSNSQTGKTQINGKDFEEKYRLLQRPKTSPAGCGTGLARDPNQIQMDALRIRSFSITSSRKSDNREKLGINGDNDDFNNVKEMKSVYEHRIKSAINREFSSVRKEKKSKEFEKRAKTSTPRYWKTKNSNNGLQNSSLEKEEKQTISDVSQRLRGSFLQNLLQRNSDLRHSVDCPYKCRGCFRACLVSEKFVDYYLGKRVSDSPSVPDAYSRNEHKTSKCFT